MGVQQFYVYGVGAVGALLIAELATETANRMRRAEVVASNVGRGDHKL